MLVLSLPSYPSYNIFIPYCFCLSYSTDKMKELKAYLKQLDCRSIAPAAHGSRVTDENVVKEIEGIVDALKAKKSKKKKCKMQVRPHLLLRVCEKAQQWCEKISSVKIKH